MEASGLPCLIRSSPGRNCAPFRPSLPKNPRAFVRFGQRIGGKKFGDAAFRDHAGRIAVGVIAMSTALTDEFGLTQPIVRGGECADGACLGTILLADYN